MVFVNEAHTVPTRHPAFLILHNPPPIRERYRAFAVEGTRELTLIATSRYAAALWAVYLDVDVATISVVYPFAEPGFVAQPRPVHEAGETRVLFAGRLSPEKGIYTLLRRCTSTSSSRDAGLTFTATTAGADKPQGKIIERLLGARPGISVVGSRRTPSAMAALMARHDIVVIPSNSQYWHQTYGIVSIEAQHAGCRSSPPTTAGCRRPTAARYAGPAGRRRGARLGHHQGRRQRAGVRGRPAVGRVGVRRRAVRRFAARRVHPGRGRSARGHRQTARRADRGAVGHGAAHPDPGGALTG